MQVRQQQPQLQPQSTDDNEIFLRELFASLRTARWLVICVIAICVAAVGLASWLVPKKYEATLLVSPVSSSSNSSGLGGALSAAASQLGGIASLAGLSFPNNGGAKAESLAILESEALTEKYIHDNDLLPVLFRKQWDSQRRSWKSTDPDSVPTLWRGNQYFKDKIRTLKENPRTGLVTMTITWTDPKVAAQWANGLVKLANDYLREKTINESERNIAYLNDQLTKTSVVELRNSIYSLMESEIKKAMLARGTEDYALKVIDPAVAPEKAASPQPMLWILAALSAGILLSIAFIFVRLLVAGPPMPRID